MKESTTWRAEPIKQDTDLSKIKLVKKKCANQNCCQTWKATKKSETVYCSYYCGVEDGAKRAGWTSRI